MAIEKTETEAFVAAGRVVVLADRELANAAVFADFDRFCTAAEAALRAELEKIGANLGDGFRVVVTL